MHDPDQVAHIVLEKSTWAVLMLTLHIELFTQLHYRESIGPDKELSPLFKDVFLYHWKEESQHAIMDELELTRHNRTISAGGRDKAVDEFIDLVCAVDGILCRQAADDSRYFAESCGRPLSGDYRRKLEAALRNAYRWQYILSGAKHPRFLAVLRFHNREPGRADTSRPRNTDVIGPETFDFDGPWVHLGLHRALPSPNLQRKE